AASNGRGGFPSAVGKGGAILWLLSGQPPIDSSPLWHHHCWKEGASIQFQGKKTVHEAEFAP
ncbi:hypothetical protein K0M31_019756, partial [Melipona bicolor]